MKGFEILSNFLNNNLKKRIKIINDYLDGKITEDKREELDNDIIGILDTDMRQKVDSMFLEPNFTVKSKYLKSLEDQSLVKELKSILNKKPKPAPKKEAPKPKPAPKKKAEPKKTTKLEKEFKKFQMAETLIKEFLDDNKGWENKDYSSLKNLRQYEDTFKNYDKFLKAYNTMNVMKAKREFNRERVEKLRDEIVSIRNKMRTVYDNRKDATKKPSKYGYETFKKKLDEAIKVSPKSLDDLTKKSKERLSQIEKELKDGTNRREIVSVKTDISTTKSSAGGGITLGDKFNLVIKFGLNEGEELTRATRNKIPRATILPFEKDKKK